jgi:sulfofructose kinase
MEFGLELPEGKAFDAVALGLNAVDHLIVVPQFPRFNSKIQFVSVTRAPGGQAATAMVALARLGLKTLYIGTVGSDEPGRFQLDSISSEGVDTSGVKIVEGARSQTAYIIVDQTTGERTVLWDRDPLLTMRPSEVDRQSVISGRVLHLDGHDVEASIQAAVYAREAGVPTVLDIDNYYPGADRLLPLIDFNICSSEFPRRVTGEDDLKRALKEIQSRSGSRLVASTIGKDGVLAYFNGEYIHSPGFEIECVDTTGAGDAFHGGFIFGLLNKKSVEETFRFANAVAALKCRAVGARTALPTRSEVEEFLRGGGGCPPPEK